MGIANRVVEFRIDTWLCGHRANRHLDGAELRLARFLDAASSAGSGRRWYIAAGRAGFTQETAKLFRFSEGSHLPVRQSDLQLAVHDGVG